MIIQGTNKPIKLRIKKTGDVNNITAISAELFAVTGVSTVKKLKHWERGDMQILVVKVDKVDYLEFTLPQVEAETLNYPAGKCKLEVKFLGAQGYIDFMQKIDDCIVQWDDKTVLGA